MKILEKLLNRSNSYVYYKNSHESLIKSENQLNNHIDKLNTELNNKNHIISNLNNKVSDYEKLIEVFEKKFALKSSKSYKTDINKINIAYILSGFPIHSETFIVSEVKWLIENGFNIIVFTRDNSYKPIEIDFDVDIIRFDNISQLETLLIEYDIDLMHTHFVYPIGTYFTFPVAEKLGIPFTVFAHAYDIFVSENDRINNIDEISKSEYCKAIFTLSNFHKNYLLERGVVQNKIIVTKQATNYELNEIKPKNNPIKHIVSISRFVEKKGLDVLIDAAKLLEDENFEFLIYGFGDLENDLKKQIDELSCKNISIKGELPPNDVRNILSSADLLACPCKVAKDGDRDGFPTVIFEAMAVGLPILTTKVSAIPEIIEDGVNGFIIEPNNPKKFAQKIVEISELSSEDLLKIREQAQNDVKDISSVDKTMNKFVETVMQ